MRIATLRAPSAGGNFERLLKRLEKAYPSVRQDIDAALAPLVGVNAPTLPRPPAVVQVPRVAADVLKVRVPSSDQKKGKSGGLSLAPGAA